MERRLSLLPFALVAGLSACRAGPSVRTPAPDKSLPDHHGEACGRGLRYWYLGSDAHKRGIEGVVVFRIELDETGRIRSLLKLKGIDRELDEMAAHWLRFSPGCRFTPAIDRQGRPRAYVIEEYQVVFELR